MPAVAGQFYPGSQTQLRGELGSLVQNCSFKKDALACIMPHAGYTYSGKVAGAVVSKIRIKSNAIILGPNHTGYGKPFSVISSGKWHTPLGDVAVNGALASLLLENDPLLEEDYDAHRFEHSIEVEVPFLQYLKPDISIVPIVVLSAEINTLEAIGINIARALKAGHAEKDTLIVASSDMTHYESAESAKKKDMVALDDIAGMDERKLFNDAKKLDMTMCGIAPVIVAMVAAKALGAKYAELIKYQTSGDVTGDNSSVVGYAGVIIN